jgi:OOP family OmpA-OmpF porin
MFGASYTLGKNDSSMEWINPVDIISTQINSVEKELEGLSIDSDGDGVADKFDQDNNTPAGVAVDGSGKPLDVDSDGVYDYLDSDPFTSPGVSVDSNGRELDTDGDGVPNSKDMEPNSASGATVNFQGKQIVGKGAFLPTVYFDFNSTEVSYANYQRLATVASVMKENPSYVLRVIGYADAVGSNDANYKLGIKRANAVIESLVNTFGLSIDRMIADSQGENNPLTVDGATMQSGITGDGLAKTKNVSGLNRRVQFIVE